MIGPEKMERGENLLFSILPGAFLCPDLRQFLEKEDFSLKLCGTFC